MLQHVAGWVREAVPAAAASAGTSAVGFAFQAPTWLMAVAQTAVVVVFVLKGIDKKLEKLHGVVNETRGEVETLKGRMNGLACLGPRGTPMPRECA